jgi:hypothetical protein
MVYTWNVSRCWDVSVVSPILSSEGSSVSNVRLPTAGCMISQCGPLQAALCTDSRSGLWTCASAALAHRPCVIYCFYPRGVSPPTLACHLGCCTPHPCVTGCMLSMHPFRLRPTSTLEVYHWSTRGGGCHVALRGTHVHVATSCFHFSNPVVHCTKATVSQSLGWFSLPVQHLPVAVDGPVGYRSYRLPVHLITCWQHSLLHL